MICWKCGMEIKKGNKDFCEYCGAQKHEEIQVGEDDRSKLYRLTIREKIHKERLKFIILIIVSAIIAVGIFSQG